MKNKRELIRKVIHFSGLSYLPVYIYFGRDFVLLCVIIIFFIALFLEILRLKYGFFSSIVRNYEKRKIGAHIYFGIATIFITSIFPKDTCISAVTIAILGDGVAGILKNLSLRALSSISMLIVSLIACIVLMNFGVKIIPASFACVAATLIERIEKIGKYYINDNLTVPITSAFTYELAKYIIQQ